MKLYRSFLGILFLILGILFLAPYRQFDSSPKVFAAGGYASGITDTCGRLRFSNRTETPVCAANIEEIEFQECRVTNPNIKNVITSYGGTVTISSNDGQPHTFVAHERSNFCRDGYAQMNGRYCVCNDPPPKMVRQTLTVPANGSVTFSLGMSSPTGEACGNYQVDFYVDSVDGNPTCRYGSLGGFGSPGINFLCSTGITCGTGPTPTPTLSPTSTITGNVFNDANKNRLKDGGESNYSGNVTITSTNPGGQVRGTIANGAGVYTVSGLTPGSYIISYTSLPVNYTLINPQTGPPPSYQVIVGPGCNTNSAIGASCVGGNIANLNFAITDSHPWMQSYDLDIRFDNGYTTLIPPAPQYPPYAIAQSMNASNPGIVFSGDGTASFGQGQSSGMNWLVGGTIYPEVHSMSGGRLQTSYQALLESATRGNLPRTNLTSFSSCSNLSNCTLPPDLPNGIYVANGTVNLNAYTVFGNRSYIFLINGDLLLNGAIVVPTGSTALFAAARDIIVPSTVGAVSNAFPLPSAQIQGFYSAGEDFIVQGVNNCLSGADRMFVLAGGIIVNAAGNGGNFVNQRDLCGDNPNYPAISIQARPDFILNAPTFLMRENTSYREEAP